MNAENEKLLIEIIKRVCKLEINEGCIEETLKKENCDLKASLGFDSLLMVELIVEIEDAFGFEFDMNSLSTDTLKYYDGLKRAIEKYL
ncbi:MAG: acyl carrier protein [Lachnospiraceae bacterium]